VNVRWRAEGLEPFGLGVGLSTGPVATAVLGSADRYEYTIVGDTVNLAQRLESNARPAGTTVASEATIAQASSVDGYEPMPPMTVKGRVGSTAAFRRAMTWVPASIPGAPAGGSGPAHATVRTSAAP
jgi:class 3 adenylate cyclase